jgi:hypothetical protein
MNYRKSLRETSKLKILLNPDPSKFIELQDSSREMIAKRSDFAFSMIDIVKEPESFEDQKWVRKLSSSMRFLKEFEEMKAKGV